MRPIASIIRHPEARWDEPPRRPAAPRRATTADVVHKARRELQRAPRGWLARLLGI